MTRVVRLVTTVVLVLIAAAALGWVVSRAWAATRPLPEVLQGQMEARQVNASFKIGGRVRQVTVREGDRVERGQPLAELASPEIDARLTQARAAEEGARALRDKADAGAREEETRQAYATWQRARAATDIADKTFARLDRLQRDGVVPAQRRDEAEAQLKAATQAEETAKAVYDMAVAGAREEDKRAARAGVQRAAGAVNEVQAFAVERTLSAPVAGEVLRRTVEPGELVGPGSPVVTIVELADTWAVFQVREDRLNGVQPGDRFEARVPALGSARVGFVVSYVAAEADFATARPTNLQGGFDLRTFEVRARPVSPVERLRPGMSVLVDGGVLAAASPSRP